MLGLLLGGLDPDTTIETVVWEANQNAVQFARSHGFVEVVDRYLAPGDIAPFLTLRLDRAQGAGRATTDEKTRCAVLPTDSLLVPATVPAGRRTAAAGAGAATPPERAAKPRWPSSRR